MPIAPIRHNLVPQPGIRLAARILTGLLTAVLIFFGIQYFGNPEPTRVIVGLLHYPPYVLPIIGTAMILGGVGLQIPGMPRLTEWVYAGLTINLLLSTLSHIASQDAFSNTLHPLALLAVLMSSYFLRRRMGGPLGGY